MRELLRKDRFEMRPLSATGLHATLRERQAVVESENRATLQTIDNRLQQKAQSRRAEASMATRCIAEQFRPLFICSIRGNKAAYPPLPVGGRNRPMQRRLHIKAGNFRVFGYLIDCALQLLGDFFPARQDLAFRRRRHAATLGHHQAQKQATTGIQPVIQRADQIACRIFFGHQTIECAERFAHALVAQNSQQGRPHLQTDAAS